MKLTRYITAFCLPFVVLTACETDRDIVTFDSTTATPATLSIDGEAQNQKGGNRFARSYRLGNRKGLLFQ